MNAPQLNRASSPRRAGRPAVAVALLAMVLWGGQPAASSTGVDKLSDEEAELFAAVRRTTAEIARLNEAVRHLDARMQMTAERLRHAQARHALRLMEQQRIAHRLLRTRAQLDAAEDVLVAQAVAAHIWGRLPTAIDLLRSSPKARRFATARTVIDAVLAAQHERIVRFRKIEAEVDRLFDRSRRASEAAAAEHGAIESERAALRAQRDAASGLRADARAAAVAQGALLAQVLSHRAQFEAETAALTAESLSLRRQLGVAAPGPHDGLGDPLTAPVERARVSSRFGPRVHPVFGAMRQHAGIDFAAPSGAPVRPAAAGTVLIADALRGYGLTVVVQHGDDIATVYAHMSFIAVAKGDTIQRGTLIGFVGSTGTATGPHLHFELRVHGFPVDPAQYLSLDS